MPTHALSYADIQHAIATTRQVIANQALAPVILALAQQSQTHNVSPEHALMMLLKYQGDSDEHQQ
ncbi:hypothetical protein L1D55_14125 [Vibrio sp. Isolate22]|uniref:hypothetical protein n=1 Tax=Vibrio sp. Isolate22 TaxID=2908532 RepID=UPI001EFD740A|nr:hypothetical protein [Vibrio sp. Isolate22]MCG9692862.1 hypothetical protein [Vibrio sp. Isolate22]